MARTHLALKEIRAPYNATNSETIKAKFDDFDHSIDALEGGTTSTVVTIHPVRCASTANVANLAAFTVANDGVTLVATNRVLLKDQSAPAENGIYVVGTVGGGTAPLTRATDFDESAEVKPNTVIAVAAGTANANTFWELNVAAAPTIGSTSLPFVQIFTATELASTAASKGASLIGVQDSAALIEGATVETALANIAKGTGLSGQVPVRRVRAVSTTNIASFTGVSTTFDGLTLVAGDRILVTAQSTGAEEGIYVVGTVGGGTADWTRAADWAASSTVPNGTVVIVDAGTAGANTIWKISNAGAITVGSTNPTWERLYTSTELLSTANAKGASLIGIEDTATQITGTNVETALAEIVPKTIQKKTVNVVETALSGTSQAVNIGTALPANAVVIAHEIVVNTQGVLAGNDLTITMGGTTANAIVASTDLDALAPGKYQGTLGAHPRGSFSSEQLVATFAASDLATLSAGDWTFNVWYMVLA